MKKNIIFIAVIVSLAVLCTVLFALNSKQGAVAIVDITNAQSVTIPLNQNKTYTLTQGKLPVTLIVEDETIRFSESVCPDHVCEGFGRLKNENEQAICLPAGVVVTVAQNN